MSQHITILIPVFNDTASLKQLLNEIHTILKEIKQYTFSILIINDASTEEINLIPAQCFPVKILNLQRNIGHQKAITIGMAYIKENCVTDKVLVMDCDGEDRPEDALQLINNSDTHPDKIIFAMRKSRNEGSRFRFFYKLYKLLFRILTGRQISFGNFFLMPKSILDKVVYYSEIWNHVAGGILKTNLPYFSIITHRGKRYHGSSKMDFNSLLIHGLGAISVFIEVIASRLLVFSLFLISTSLVAIFILLGVRTFTDLAIPGWTSTVVSAMLIVLLQSFLLSLFTIFLYLSSQSQRKFIPALHYHDYTGSVVTIE